MYSGWAQTVPASLNYGHLRKSTSTAALPPIIFIQSHWITLCITYSSQPTNTAHLLQVMQPQPLLPTPCLQCWGNGCHIVHPQQPTVCWGGLRSADSRMTTNTLLLLMCTKSLILTSPRRSSRPTQCGAECTCPEVSADAHTTASEQIYVRTFDIVLYVCIIRAIHHLCTIILLPPTMLYLSDCVV